MLFAMTFKVFAMFLKETLEFLFRDWFIIPSCSADGSTSSSIDLLATRSLRPRDDEDGGTLDSFNL